MWILVTQKMFKEFFKNLGLIHRRDQLNFQINFLPMCFPVGLTHFPLSDKELPFWRKIKFFGTLGKA